MVGFRDVVGVGIAPVSKKKKKKTAVKRGIRERAEKGREVILTTKATTTTTTTTTAAATTADSGLLGQITTFFNMNRYLVSSIFSAIISNLIQIIYSLF